MVESWFNSKRGLTNFVRTKKHESVPVAHFRLYLISLPEELDSYKAISRNAILQSATLILLFVLDVLEASLGVL